MSEAKGLSLVLAEPGANLSEEEYHDWYDNEHVPARLTIPSFLTAARYKSNDGQLPTYLTLYDLADHTAANGPEYQAVFANGSARDKRLLQALECLNRRSYSLIRTLIRSDASPSEFESSYILLVGLDVTPEAEAEFNKWYNEEHLGLLSKVPGFLRARRYVLEANAIRGQVEPEVQVYKYLALYNFANGQYAEAPEYKEATSTPWRAEIVKHVRGRELRMFEPFRTYKRPE